ncbi:MAG: hypothetical protein QOD07_1500 [Frankiaceae bacterium]|nr:hypothetical protein [Frankiaceae bacterium]
MWTLGLPTVATVLAIAWVAWSTRERGPAQTHESVAAHERFKKAMAKQSGAKPPAPRRAGSVPSAPKPRRPADTPTRRAS